MVMYGQVVVGPPGSGKTTYCNGMQQYLRLLGRETFVINLDPANEYYNGTNDDSDAVDDEPETEGTTTETNEQQQSSSPHLPYDTILDACEDMINLSSVMTELNFGPNGGLVYCMEYIEHHITELIELLRGRLCDYSPYPYILIDLPGQVELYTHCTCIQTIVERFVKELDLRLCAVHLVDAHSSMDASKFISTALLSTTTMLRLELPAVNVLSKVDLLGQYGDEQGTPFNLDYFMECQELNRLLPFLHHDGRHEQDEELYYRIIENDVEYRKAKEKTNNTIFYKKHHKLHMALCEVIEDYSLLTYMPLNINDAVSVGRVLTKIDKCNGYIFTANTTFTKQQTTNNDNKNVNAAAHDMFQCAMQYTDSTWQYEQVAEVQENYMGLFDENIPELHQKKEKKNGKEETNS